MEKAKVYFTKELTPEKVVEMYKALGVELPGKVACKVHSGEAGNQNFIRPDFLKPVVDYVKGTIVECNTAYPGKRFDTDQHKKVVADHKWDSYFNVDIADAEGPDMELAIPNGKTIKRNLIGKNFANYDSMLVLIHYKGHGMGGYGGALKQLSIGCASAAGKTWIHSAGVSDVKGTMRETIAAQDDFLSSMADAAASVTEMFKGKIAYVALMKNMSVDCDCASAALPPEFEDVGILASTDPVALDQACFDRLLEHPNRKVNYLIDRINSRHGLYTIDCAADLGIGTKEYELINVD